MSNKYKVQNGLTKRFKSYHKKSKFAVFIRTENIFLIGFLNILSFFLKKVH